MFFEIKSTAKQKVITIFMLTNLQEELKKQIKKEERLKLNAVIATALSIEPNKDDKKVVTKTILPTMPKQYAKKSVPQVSLSLVTDLSELNKISRPRCLPC